MIVILTDFGNTEYLGVMKGVIYAYNKKAKITDLMNSITPYQIIEGAWILLQNYKFFPKKTVFLCVVDPGVGGKRNSIAIQTKNYYFVGPDNGLMYQAANEDDIKKAVILSNEGAEPTFHGRDVFAKAAAVLDKGTPIIGLGKVTHLKVKPKFYLKKRTGQIVRIDNFGNIITNLPPLDKVEYKVKTNKFKDILKHYNVYEDALEDQLFIITGSSKTLEISVRNKSAAILLKVKVGDRIEIK